MPSNTTHKAIRQATAKSEAERRVLGAILLDGGNGDALAKVFDTLKPMHFGAVPHGEVYGAILRLANRGKLILPENVLAELNDRKPSPPDGWARLLSDLLECTATSAQIEEDAEEVLESFRRREVLEMADGIYSAAEKGADTEDILGQARVQLNFLEHGKAGAEEQRPIMGEAAFHGVLGDYVRTMEPHTEADPAAILVQSLVLAGNVMGRTAHFVHEADTHYTNLFAVIVGPSATGKKGVSFGRVRRLFAATDPDWAKTCIRSGLSSGEGFIYHVRDATEDDPGVDDKRLLAREPEFAGVLKVMGREGNTLSARVRDAWDTGDLATLTRNNPLAASGVHFSILGHITPEEARRYVTATDMANGFGNRFLWCPARRSKELPRGGKDSSIDWKPLLGKLQDGVRFASTVEEVPRTEEAWERWEGVYSALTAEVPGLTGAIVSRGAAQVSRLELVFAVMDCSPVRRVEHLEAALAVWDYCRQGARWIFGDRTGDPLVDKLGDVLKAHPGGLTRTAIGRAIGYHATSAEITQALRRLKYRGRALCVTENTGGRPSVKWYPAKR